MNQKMVSLPSEQAEGSLLAAAALPSLCIRNERVENRALLLPGALQTAGTPCCRSADVLGSCPGLKALPRPSG